MASRRSRGQSLITLQLCRSRYQISMAARRSITCMRADSNHHACSGGREKIYKTGRKRNGKNMRNICWPTGRYSGKGCRRERRKRMAKNSLNLIQVENTREGIKKLADLLLVATENITYMQYKLSSQMFGGNSDVIEIRFGDCVEYVSRIIMEADARRRDELLLRIAKIPFAPLRLVLLRRYFEMQYKNPFLHFQEEVAFRTYVAMSEKRKKKRIGKNIQEYLQQKSGYIAAMCVQESNGLLLYEMLKEGLADRETVRKVFDGNPDAPVEIRACLMEFLGKSEEERDVFEI